MIIMTIIIVFTLQILSLSLLLNRNFVFPPEDYFAVEKNMLAIDTLKGHFSIV